MHYDWLWHDNIVYLSVCLSVMLCIWAKSYSKSVSTKQTGNVSLGT